VDLSAAAAAGLARLLQRKDLITKVTVRRAAFAS
jgi:hypothetical protein